MILNQQRRVPIRRKEHKNFLSRVRRELKLGRGDLNICFVNDHEIAQLNRKYRGKPKPTDVLSFPQNGNGNSAKRFTEIPGTNFLGEIAISPQAARRNAKQFGRTLNEELRILMLHGVLHLMGYDHETDHGEMERIEMRLRRKLGLA
jgi:probable rRNA maturation factor